MVAAAGSKGLRLLLLAAWVVVMHKGWVGTFGWGDEEADWGCKAAAAAADIDDTYVRAV